jgi:hypothetical protein
MGRSVKLGRSVWAVYFGAGRMGSLMGAFDWGGFDYSGQFD